MITFIPRFYIVGITTKNAARAKAQFHLPLMIVSLRFVYISHKHMCMTFEDAKDEFKDSWDNTKEAASDAASGVKKTAEGIGDEVRETLDGEDK
jgi:hypothetical protein